MFSTSNVVMGYVLNMVKTGNPLLDGILMSIILTCTSYIAMNHNTIYHKASTLLGLSSNKTLASLVVSRTEEVSRKGQSWSYSTRNMDYDALAWYITQKCPFRGHHAKALSYVDGKDKKMEEVVRHALLPVRDVPIRIEDLDADHSITATSTYDLVGSESEIRDVRLVLKYVQVATGFMGWVSVVFKTRDNEESSVYLNVLRTFMVKIRTDYRAQLKDQEWEQTLFRMNTIYDDKIKENVVEWKGNLTHSTKTFGTVILDRDVKEELCDDLDTFMNSETWYSSMGLSYKRGYMFHGPPGTGKTSLVLAIANKAKYNIYSLDLSKVRNDSVLDQAFESLPEKCIVMLEDVDCMHPCVKKREHQPVPPPLSNGGKDAKIADDADDADCRNTKSTLSLSALLNNMDGVGNNHGRIFILTTNHPEVLDPALVRYGRVDMSVMVGMCSHEQICRFFDLYYGDMATSEYVTELNARHAEGTFSPAQISSTLQQYKNNPEKAVLKLHKDADKKHVAQKSCIDVRM